VVFLNPISKMASSSQPSFQRPNPIPLSILTDSYKAGHFLMYPECQKMVAYGEFRAPYEGDSSDTRFIFTGMRYIIENFIAVPWTVEDVERADMFYKTHNAGFQPYPYPKDLFMKFVKENKGYFPVKIEALPEGSVANIHVPVYQITAEKEYSRLITFLETILTMVWYPSCVATLSRRTKDILQDAFVKSVDDEMNWLLDYKLHDFGFRGCTSVEQSILGGVAHLLNFRGSDTMTAAYYAQFHLNGGKPVAASIPATEHSVMTSWPSEEGAISNMIKHFGGPNTVFACVMDSYDYENALYNVVPKIADEHKQRGGTIVLRPDSGDPILCILQALDAGEKAFGAVKNKKGYKVINSCNCIQGDGINYKNVADILKAVLDKGYSAQNVAFGMGGGLLQKMNRDTMAFATKLSHLVDAQGNLRDIMKRPKTDGGKFSLPGILKVLRDPKTQNLTVYPIEAKDDGRKNELVVVYDNGPVNIKYPTFDEIRDNVAKEWTSTPKTPSNVLSQELKDKITKWEKDHKVGAFAEAKSDK